jgi:membrane-bound metal-dependent hydrolase YbcI (DUF457 family)
MDTITHGVAGALIAKSLSDSPHHKIARRAVLLGSVAPDLDLLGGIITGDSIFQLEFHRGITHSVIALPALALLLAYVTLRRWQGLAVIAAAYGLGLASHIFLDVITAYGTMIFQPLSRDRYTLDMVFIIDLTLGSILLVPQLVAWAWREPRRGPSRAWMMWMFTVTGAATAYVLVNAAGVRLTISTVATAVCLFAIAFAAPGLTSIAATWPRSRYCRLALGMSVAYLVACAFAHRVALERTARLASRNLISMRSIAALPAPPSLFRWSGLVEEENGFARIPIDLTAEEDPVVERYINTSPLPYEPARGASPELQTYLWFARFPWITATESAAGTVINYRDLQFVRPDPRAVPPFTFRLQFDPAGKLIAAGLASR